MDFSSFLIFPGGRDDVDSIRNNILEFNHHKEVWTNIGTMEEKRSGPAVAVVDPSDFSQWCKLTEMVSNFC